MKGIAFLAAALIFSVPVIIVITGAKGLALAAISIAIVVIFLLVLCGKI